MSPLDVADNKVAADTKTASPAYVPPLQAIEGGTLVWIFACGCGAGFALTSAQSWRTKTKWFTRTSR